MKIDRCKVKELILEAFENGHYDQDVSKSGQVEVTIWPKVYQWDDGDFHTEPEGGVDIE
jgi:hypothetical protein